MRNSSFLEAVSKCLQTLYVTHLCNNAIIVLIDYLLAAHGLVIQVPLRRAVSVVYPEDGGVVLEDGQGPVVPDLPTADFRSVQDVWGPGGVELRVQTLTLWDVASAT